MRATSGEALITSAANPLVRRVRGLASRKHRLEERACVVEGIRPVWQAVQHGAPIEVLIVAPDLLRSVPAREMVDAARAGGTRVAQIDAALFEQLASRENPSGLAAVVHAPRRHLDDLPVVVDGLFVAVLGAGNPGNLGTIIRTVDAVGGNGVVVVGQATDPYHPSAIKASMGTVFAVPVVQAPAADVVLEWCRGRCISPIATSGDTGRPHWSISYPAPCLLLFGSEGAGLSVDAIAACDQVARIPMAGSAGSLNLAVAAGVLLYEARRGQWTARH